MKCNIPGSFWLVVYLKNDMFLYIILELLVENFLFAEISQVKFLRMLECRFGDVKRFRHCGPKDGFRVH